MNRAAPETSAGGTSPVCRTATLRCEHPRFLHDADDVGNVTGFEEILMAIVANKDQLLGVRASGSKIGNKPLGTVGAKPSLT